MAVINARKYTKKSQNVEGRCTLYAAFCMSLEADSCVYVRDLFFLHTTYCLFARRCSCLGERGLVCVVLHFERFCWYNSETERDS